MDIGAQDFFFLCKVGSEIENLLFAVNNLHSRGLRDPFVSGLLLHLQFPTVRTKQQFFYFFYEQTCQFIIT